MTRARQCLAGTGIRRNPEKSGGIQRNPEKSGGIRWNLLYTQEFLSRRNSCKNPVKVAKNRNSWHPLQNSVPVKNSSGKHRKKRNPKESFFLLFFGPKNKFLSNRNRQPSYLICHLIHEFSIKQSPEEIKSSLMQDVIVPKDYNLLGVQLQYFLGAVEIFFGSESIAAFEIRRLLLQMGRLKKQFRDMIALDEWFVACFLFAIDKCFQRWLNKCKWAQISRANVNDTIIDFSNVIELVLNRTFTMPLLPSFKRINSKAAINKHSGNDLAKEDNKKKQKSNKKEKQRKSVIIKNKHQHESFKMKQNESWKRNFKSACIDSRPSWDSKKTEKMCIKWHIHWECFDNCNRKESHIPKEDIPPMKVKEMCAFMAKCSSE
jgi:hypothetical protein